MRAVWRVAAVVIAALLTLTLLDRFVLVSLFAQRTALPFALAALEALAVTGTGWLARRRRCGLARNFITGYPIFGTFCFLVALLKVNTLTMWPIVVLFAIAGAFSLRHSTFDIRHSIPLPVALVLLLALIAAQAPPSSLDELAYHLAIPHTWVTEGRAIELPLISHSYFPLGIESADLPLLTILGTLGGGIASHFLHWIAAIATTILIHRRTRDGLLTAAIVTTPALALTAGWSLVDWPLLGICVLMLDPDEWEAALPAGLLTKYTFGVVAAFIVPVCLVKARAEARRSINRALVALLAGCVFFVRNLVLTGNAFAPFFGKLAPHVAHYRDFTLGSYIFDGRFIDESLGASLLALLTSIGGPVAIALTIAGLLLWITAPSARLLVPFFATAASEATVTSRALRVVLAAAIAAQLALIAYYVHRTNVFDLLAAKQTDEEFLTAARRSYGSIAWLNASLPERSRTLVVGLNETYWFEHPTRGGGNFDGPRIDACLDAPTPEALKTRLTNDGITHVALFNEAPPTSVDKKQEERETRLSPAARRALAQMLDRYAASVTSRGEVTLFTLR